MSLKSCTIDDPVYTRLRLLEQCRCQMHVDNYSFLKDQMDVMHQSWYRHVEFSYGKTITGYMCKNCGKEGGEEIAEGGVKGLCLECRTPENLEKYKIWWVC